ncbi:MAG: mechanosensitive ion channel family protein [Bdellovibrionales bacterium]|nr:mechanosensitive ion channel family protein [Bdellovibrionales bacterium]
MNPENFRLDELKAEHLLTAVGAAVLLFVVLVVVRRILVARLTKIAPKTETLADDLLLDLLRNSKTGFFVISAIYLGLCMLPIPARFHTVAEKTFILIALLQFGSWASVGINFWITRYLKKKAESDAESATTIGLISFLSKMLLFVLIVLLALNNLGIDITALVAGLGVGGVAVALALQNILGDLFASLTIVLDKPFIVGDFIVVGDFAGTIEHIGLKTTRLRSLSGEQLIFANGDLLQSRIRNYKRMNERRIVFTIGVTYQTPSEKLALIPGWVKEAVEKSEFTRFDRCHFLKFGDSALSFEVVYWVKNADFNFYADIAHAINLALYRKFADEAVSFAYPTQTLFIEKDA